MFSVALWLNHLGCIRGYIFCPAGIADDKDNKHNKLNAKVERRKGGA
jgi:hypothetical protein